MKDWIAAHKRITFIVLSMICTVLVLWQVFAVKIRQDIQDTLIQRVSQQINGQLTVESVALSLSGRIRIQNVSLYDQQGALLAQVPVIKMQYRWSDLTSGSLDSRRRRTLAQTGQ